MEESDHLDLNDFFFKLKRHKCRFCDYQTHHLWVKKRHEKYVHKAGLHYFVSK